MKRSRWEAVVEAFEIKMERNYHRNNKEIDRKIVTLIQAIIFNRMLYKTCI